VLSFGDFTAQSVKDIFRYILPREWIMDTKNAEFDADFESGEKITIRVSL
jgi:hypothetical protein